MDKPWWRMCPPCSEVRHGMCLGGVIWCECVACVMLEAEALAGVPLPRNGTSDQGDNDGRDDR